MFRTAAFFALAMATSGCLAAGPVVPAEIANVTIEGTHHGAVTLSEGTWEGEPYVEGGAARPRVGLAADFQRRGDIDGDGRDEWLVVVWESSGGSGTYNYVALLNDDGNGPRNTATTALGDRVKPLDGGLEPGHAWVEVLEHDEDDPACCPTRQAIRHYDANLAPTDYPSRNTE